MTVNKPLLPVITNRRSLRGCMQAFRAAWSRPGSWPKHAVAIAAMLWRCSSSCMGNSAKQGAACQHCHVFPHHTPASDLQHGPIEHCGCCRLCDQCDWLTESFHLQQHVPIKLHCNQRTCCQAIVSQHHMHACIVKNNLAAEAVCGINCKHNGASGGLC